MPEEATATADNLTAQVQAQNATETGDTAPNTDNAAATQPLILGKFKSADDVIKSYSEVEKEKGRLAEELGKIRSDMETLKRQSKLEEAVAAIAESKKEKPEPAIDLESFLSTTGDELLEKPKDSLKKITGLFNSWLVQSEKNANQRIETLERKLEEATSHTTEAMQRMSPEYQQNKYMVDKMVEGGMSMAKAIGLVKDLMAADESAPIRLQRAVTPTAITPTRVTQRNEQPANNKFLYTDADLDIFRDLYPNAKEADLKQIMAEANKERQARIERKEDVR